MLTNWKGAVLRQSLVVLLGVSVLLLAGCAALTAKSSKEVGAMAQALTWPEHRQRVEGLTQWAMRAGLTVATAKKAWRASANWRQQAVRERYKLTIVGGLGTVGLVLKSTPQQVVLKTTKGQRYQATSAEALLERVLGVHLPVGNLYYWLRGVPVPGMPFKAQFNPQHRLSQLLQGHWQILYYHDQMVRGMVLPKDLMLLSTRRHLRIGLSIHTWGKNKVAR